MKSKEQKALEFLRGKEKLATTPTRDPNYLSSLNDDVMKVKKLNVSTPESIDNFKKAIPGATDHINTKAAMSQISGSDFVDKINKLRASKTVGKLMGAIPFAGAGFAALSGDPAMAAEELATDAMGPAGTVYEAIKPTDTGNLEEEQMMLAERNALEDYKNSPAAKDAQFAKIRAALGRK